MGSEQQLTNSIPISALQHLLYCPRQCALIHLEQVWEENRFTAEGRNLHERAHAGPDERRPGIRITRGLPVRSDRLLIHGECDVVEFHSDGRVVPVEYKRGKPKRHRADEVQLCAQAGCLEETLGVQVKEGHLFYGEPRRRTVVPMEEGLREITSAAIDEIHSLFARSALPPASYERRKCDACSLIEICQPKTSGSIKSWWTGQVAAALDNAGEEDN